MLGCKPMATPLAVNEKLKKLKKMEEKRWMLHSIEVWLETCYISQQQDLISFLQQVCYQGTCILQVIFTLQQQKECLDTFKALQVMELDIAENPF
jgi:hypothetical protein